MRRTWRWRGAYAIAIGTLAAGLVAGFASAAGDLAGPGTGSASTGSVTLALNAPATRTCGYGFLLPGDLTGGVTCSLSVTYTGSLPAFVSLTIAVQSSAGPGGRPLFDGSGTAGLTLSVSDGHHSYTVPAGPGSAGGACPPGHTCWTAANDLAAWYSGSQPTLAFTSGDVVTFTMTPSFPSTAGNAFQGGSATITLSAQAVQTPANELQAGCGIASIGQPCPAAGIFTWS